MLAGLFIAAATAAPLCALASLYQAEGRYADAEPLHKLSLATNEKTRGPDHFLVAGSLGTVASLYLNQGRYADAEPLLKRALAIEEKTFGPDHPNVAGTLSILGSVYQAEGLQRLTAETAAWEQQRDAARARIKWMFTTGKSPRENGSCLPAASG